jgi:hypothetical protein
MRKSEIGQSCEAVLELVQTNLASILARHGFELAHKEDTKLGERCMFVFRSKECQLRVTSEFGSVGIELGSASAPASWSASPLGKREWFDIYSVFEFVEGRKPTIEEIRQHGRRLWSMRPEDMLKDLADQLELAGPKVFAVFADGLPSARREALESFISG